MCVTTMKSKLKAYKFEDCDYCRYRDSKDDTCDNCDAGELFEEDDDEELNFHSEAQLVAA